jgi:chromosome segregation ATPase
MTRTRFGFAVIFQSFGLLRKTKRMTDAAFEAHLMQDGEELLGKYCWKNIENIEDLSMEYWNIRRLEREQKEIQGKIDDAERILEEAHQRRAEAADRSNEMGQGLYTRREELFETLDKFKIERDDIKTEAQYIKRKYEGFRMKARVLKEEGQEDTERYRECREKLVELKDTFNGCKEVLMGVGNRIDTEQGNLNGLQAQIDQKLQGAKDETSESYSQISRANKDITMYQAELGLLQEENSVLCREVGRYLNVNFRNPACKKIYAKHSGLLEQLKLLRDSVAWNRKLIERITK